MTAPGPDRWRPSTVSHSTMNSVPGIGSGRRRPCASGSPSFMRWNSTPETLPFSPVTMRVGAAWKMRRAPSSMASCASSAGRHVLEVAAVDEGHLGCALADGGPRAVDGRESAADDDDASALQARNGNAARRVVEVLEGVDHAVGVLSGDAELVRLVAADADVDGVVLVDDVAEVEVAAEPHVRLERRAELPDVVELAVHPALGEAVLGNPVAEHAALLGIGLEHVAVVAPQLEVVRRGHAGRAGADHGHLASAVRLLRPRDRRGSIDLEDPIGAVPMRVADGDGGVHLLAAAVRLARCRADAPEDGGEGKRPLQDPRRLFPVPERVLLEVAGNVDAGRALELARRQAVRVVVAEDELEDHAPVLDDAIGMGGDDHPFLDGGPARDRGVVAPFHLDGADAARAVRGELGLVAQRRDLDPEDPTGLEDGLALLGLDLGAVDRDGDLPGAGDHRPQRRVVMRLPVARAVAVRA